MLFILSINKAPFCCESQHTVDALHRINNRRRGDTQFRRNLLFPQCQYLLLNTDRRQDCLSAFQKNLALLYDLILHLLHFPMKKYSIQQMYYEFVIFNKWKKDHLQSTVQVHSGDIPVPLSDIHSCLRQQIEKSMHPLPEAAYETDAILQSYYVILLQTSHEKPFVFVFVPKEAFHKYYVHKTVPASTFFS